jgi:hypothetical protein
MPWRAAKVSISSMRARLAMGLDATLNLPPIRATGDRVSGVGGIPKKHSVQICHDDLDLSLRYVLVIIYYDSV